MKKIFCDLCHKEITGDIHKVGFGVVQEDRVETDEELESIEQDMDFCSGCVRKIADSIRSRTIGQAAAAEPKQKSVPAKPMAKKKKNSVDVAKVWSLADAGWKAPAIAEEVSCSDQTVYNILKRPRPEMERAYEAN